MRERPPRDLSTGGSSPGRGQAAPVDDRPEPMRAETDGRPDQPRFRLRDRVQELDFDSLAIWGELRAAIEGEVRFDDGARAIYSTDASNYRQIPIGVVLPRSADDVVTTLGVARRHGAPILARGGGTSLAGQCCNAGIVIDFSKYMNRILEIDPEHGWARVEPGVVLDDLRREAEQHHLTFGPDPATHSHCTLGGMIGNNSCGIHALMSGRTSDNILELEVLTWDGVRMRVGATSEEELERRVGEGGREGAIYAGLREIRDAYAERIRERYPDIPRRVSGYNLDELLPENGFQVARALTGSESTCVLVLEAKVKLVESPKERTLVVLGFENVFVAGDRVPEVLKHDPIGLEGLDRKLTRDMRRKGLHADNLDLLPEGDGWLLVEFGGATREEADERAKRAVEELGRLDPPPSSRIHAKRRDQEAVWQIRESGLGATAHVPGRSPTWPGWEDAAVPPHRVGDYLREFQALLDRFGYDCDLYGHFGQGCIHCRIDFDFRSEDGLTRFRHFVEESAQLVVSYGGSLSGEHGDGQARGELLERMFGAEIVDAFRKFKRLWDPGGKMNPGKVVDPYRLDENLRVTDGNERMNEETYFRYPDDANRFDRAVLRCVGVGKCRRLDGGTMCPSFMVTREEEHSTRGRARALYEMMRGESVLDGWKSEGVKQALDLCLSCKGCKNDCPVDVDLATYKAEFLAHYYERRIRPVAAYTMGLIRWWARLASLAPPVVNFFGSAPPFAGIVKRLGGIAPERDLPKFASRARRARIRRPAAEGGKRVVLWVDTFSEYFQPETAVAAREVLERAGYSVLFPARDLCCGRPLYDWGFLGLARKLLERNLDALAPLVAEGVPVVGLEPSCVSVFRDELPNLLADDPRSRDVAKSVVMLSELIAREGESFPLPRIERDALVQIHCHQKSVLDRDAELRVLERLGIEIEIPEQGCCGMAGAFGFEAEKYEVSRRIGERSLLPAARVAPQRRLLIANGFSCREQIAQATGRVPRHLAEVIREGWGVGE